MEDYNKIFASAVLGGALVSLAFMTKKILKQTKK